MLLLKKLEYLIEKKRENVGVIGCCKRQIDHPYGFVEFYSYLRLLEWNVFGCSNNIEKSLSYEHPVSKHVDEII